MAWVVDTSVVVDLVTGDPLFEPASTACLQAHLGDGLVISPVTFVELGPSFSGDDAAAEAFLKSSQFLARLRLKNASNSLFCGSRAVHLRANFCPISSVIITPFRVSVTSKTCVSVSGESALLRTLISSFRIVGLAQPVGVLYFPLASNCSV